LFPLERPTEIAALVAEFLQGEDSSESVVGPSGRD
jgi:hypothetical protein